MDGAQGEMAFELLNVGLLHALRPEPAHAMARMG
jgi:hypothetical protein